MRPRTSSEMIQLTIGSLGLDSTTTRTVTMEVLSCLLRRAASFHCPCPPSTLVRAVLEPLRGLVPQDDSLRSLTEHTLDVMISHGDILELPSNSSEEDGDCSTLLFAAPPAFVKKKSGAVMLLGMPTDDLGILPEEMACELEIHNHVRIIRAGTLDEVEERLEELGLVKLSTRSWSKAPKSETALEHLTRIGRMLESTSASGEIQGLLIIDPSKPVAFYPGRWCEPAGFSGKFVGRRPQEYGCPIWCYAELDRGYPTRFIDLPSSDSIWRGCDEAWRIQAAIDFNRGEAQIFSVRIEENQESRIDFYSPIPMWVSREIETIAKPVVSRGCLFSYILPNSEVDELVESLENELWMKKA